MLDGTYYFECQCGSDEHTLKFTLDKGGDACDDVAEIYTSVFLNAWEPWYRRAWSAIKYTFGYKCKYGHWDCWILRNEEAGKLRAMLDEFDRLQRAAKTIKYKSPRSFYKPATTDFIGL